MRKLVTYLIAMCLAAAVVLGGAFFYVEYEAELPQNKIINTWESDRAISKLEFKEDGTVALVLSNFAINGTYTMDTKKSEIDIIYTFMNISYTRHFTYEFEEYKLLLTDIDSGVKFAYTRA